MDSPLIVNDWEDAPDITKIEIEILDNGRSRWNLWSRSKRLFVSRPVGQDDLQEMFAMAGLVLLVMAETPPNGN